MIDQAFHALHRCGGAGLQLERVAHQACDRIGYDDRPRRRQAADPGRQIGAQPIHVRSRGVQIDHATVHADSDTDLESEARPGLGTQFRYRTGDLQAGEYGAPHVVLMCHRVTENSQQAVARGRADMTPEAVHDSQHLFAIPADHQPVRLRLDAGRQRGRIHQVGEKYCQPPDLATMGRRGKQFLGVGIAFVGGKYLPRQRRRRRMITGAERRYRPI